MVDFNDYLESHEGQQWVTEAGWNNWNIDSATEQALSYAERGQSILDRAQRMGTKLISGMGSETQVLHGGIEDWKLDEIEGGRTGFDFAGYWKDKANRSTAKDAGLSKRDFKGLSNMFTEVRDLRLEGKDDEANTRLAAANAEMERLGLSTEQLTSDYYKPTQAFKGKTGELLMSPEGMLLGEMTYRGEQLQDPNSDTSRELFKNLTKDPLEEVAHAQNQSLDTLANAERESARFQRDFSGMGGAMRSYGAEQAEIARSSERFGGARTEVNQNTGLARAKILGDAARFYEDYRASFATNTLDASARWRKDAPYVNTAYQQLSSQLAATSAEIAMQGVQLSAQMHQNSLEMAYGEYQRQDNIRRAEQKADDDSWMQYVGLAVGVLGLL